MPVIFDSGVQRLFETMAAIYIQTTRMTQKALRVHDLTYPQFGALLVLSVHDGPRQKDLAEILNTDSTTAMVICDGLEKKKLIERVRDPDDRRAYRLILTPAGREAVANAGPSVEAIFAPLAALIGKEELQAVLPVLERIQSRLKDTD